MNRINQLFSSNKKDILSIYFCAGDPTLDGTADVIRTLEKLINSIHDYWKFKMMILVHSGMSGYVPYPSFPVLVQNGC